MVQEIRNIMLSMDEVQAAFMAYQRVAPDFMPKGHVVACKTAGESVVITMELTYGGSSQRSDIVFKGIDVLKPLIRFCIENNVMLPRDGRKSIIYKADRIVMHIELDLAIDMPTTVKPMDILAALKNDGALAGLPS